MEFPLSAMEWCAATIVVAAATLLQGSIGFGVALVAAPLLYLIDPLFVPAPMILAAFGVSGLVYWRERMVVEHAEILRVLVGVAVGTLAAGLVLRAVPGEMLGLLFGALVLLGVLLSIGLPPPDPGRRLLFAAGALSGFMGTATSIGGPPLALMFQRRHGTHLRGTLAACFLPSTVLALAALYWASHLGVAEFVLGLSLLPAVAAGFWASRWTADRLEGGWLRATVLLVSALAAIGAIVRALW